MVTGLVPPPETAIQVLKSEVDCSVPGPVQEITTFPFTQATCKGLIASVPWEGTE